MGRVDEAMRRVAEAQSGGSIPAELERGDSAAPTATLAGLEVEAFPPETAERPRLRSVAGGVAESAPRKTAPTMLPSLSARLNTQLSRKIVTDQEIDPASKEQYRRLATTLHAAQAANGLKVVMVASALAGEGKSLTASNLALTFSESYQKNVLLIDGDLRRPSLHTVFGLSATPGLTDGLAASDDSKLKLHHVTPNLTILTAGQPTSDPMAALASERMHRLVQEARESFDWVVIDTPPVGLLADANLLGEIADGALLVVRAAVTPYDIVQRAVGMLGRDRLLGVILNQADFTMTAGYHSYYYAPVTAASSR
jgi:protein-tyrosine kinase